MIPTQVPGIQHVFHAIAKGVRLQCRVVLILLTTFAITPNTATAQEAYMNGEFVLNRNASDDLNAVIEQAVARLNVVTRPTERTKLRNSNTAYPRIVLAANKKEVIINYITQPVVTCPINGTPVQWMASNGEKYNVSTEWRDKQLVQTLNHQKGEGSRTNTFTVSPDGKTVTMYVVFRKPRLPEPVLYKLVFNRQS